MIERMKMSLFQLIHSLAEGLGIIHGEARAPPRSREISARTEKSLRELRQFGRELREQGITVDEARGWIKAGRRL